MGPGRKMTSREGVPGERMRVLARRNGDASPSVIGDVVIEDLRGVLTRIQSDRGANGPQGPMTQFILAAAADHLYQRIVGDFQPDAAPEPTSRILSALIGHEPFLTETLALNVNQMRRRWPMAGDWYTDLLAYVLRPQRHHTNADDVEPRLDRWGALSLGEFLEKVAGHQLAVSKEVEMYRLADMIKWLWPKSEAVRRAEREEMAFLISFWQPILIDMLGRYGLRLRGDVDVADVAWAANTLITWQAHQETIDASLISGWSASPGGRSLSVRSFLLCLAGAVTDEKGEPVSPANLGRRPPQGSESIN